MQLNPETMRRKQLKTLREITLLIPEPWLELIDDLVKMKKYPHRSEAIRMAIRDLIYTEHPKFKEEMKLHAKKERTATRA